MSTDVLTRSSPPADVRLTYGTDPLQFGDLRLPKRPRSGLVPILVNIHGGFWRAQYDLLHAGPLCAALTAAGIATFNLEYRRVGNPGGGWPGSLSDVISAAHFLRGLASRYRLDMGRLLVMGHSAGAQLALCLAGHLAGVLGAVSLAGVLDLRRAFELHLSGDAVKEFLGGAPGQVSEHYKEASPLEIALPHGLRQLIVHGAKDETVPPAFSRDYVTRKAREGERVTLLELPAAGHFELIDPLAAEWKPIERAISNLIR